MESEARKQRTKHWFYGESTVDISELNIDEFPLGLLARSIPKGQKRLEFSDTIEDRSTGEKVRRTLVISANVDTELPNYWDQDVQVALMILSHRRDPYHFPERVEFTIYEVLQVMKLPNTTKNIRRVVKSLDNWNGVRFKYSHWWNGSSWDHPKAFVLLQDYDLSRRQLRNKTPDTPQVFTWGRHFVESVRASRTKPFDSDFYFGLENPTTRRVFRFLDKRLEVKPWYRKNLVDFATDKLGLGRNRKPSQYPEKLRGAYDELVREGFLANIGEETRFKNPNTGEWQFYCKRGKGRKDRSKVAVPLKLVVDNEPIGELENELSKRGVQTGSGATECGGIVATCGEELIRSNLERYDWLVSNGREVTPGLLISQTRKGHLIRLPEGAQTGSQKKKIAEAVAAKKSLQEKLDEKDKAFRPHYDRIPLIAFDALSEDLQNELWEDALEAASNGDKTLLRSQSKESSTYRLTRDAVLRKRFESVRKRTVHDQDTTWAEQEWNREGRLAIQRLKVTDHWKEYAAAKDAFREAENELKKLRK